MGTIFATIAYVWAYLGGFDQIPGVLQRMSNLGDIRLRLAGLDRPSGARHVTTRPRALTDLSAEVGPAALLTAPESGGAEPSPFGERPVASPPGVLRAGERRVRARGGPLPAVQKSVIASSPSIVTSASIRGVEAPGRFVLVGTHRCAEHDLGATRLGSLHPLAEDRPRPVDEDRDNRRARPCGEVGRATLEVLAPSRQGNDHPRDR